MIVVIGAGPAGLSASHHLRSDHVVLEGQRETGGLCRSFELAGAVFDLGGHAYFTKHPEVRELVESVCLTGLYTQPRRAFVRSHGTFVRYPFQSHLHGLPHDVVVDCLAGLVEAVAARGEHPPRTVAEWIQRSFGPGIAHHFLTPYNEKIWAHPLDQISPEWSSERIITPDVRSIVAGALAPVEFRDFPNVEVGYPAEGGFQNLYEGLGRRELVRTGEGARSLELERRRLTTTRDLTIDFTHVISTMPLDELVDIAVDAPSCCREAADRLRFFSLTLVNLVVDRSAITEMQRIYSADPEVPFHKLVLNSNSSATLRARDVFGIQAEVSRSEHKPLDRPSLVERTIDSLQAMGVLENDDSIVESSLVDVDRAYPVYTAETTAAREHLLDHLASWGVSCAGRFGEWLYINSDTAVMRGRERALAIEGS